MNLLGGKDKLEAHLDKLFTAEAETSGRNQADITGLIGQYAHGNEPSHHMAYLYNFIGKPHKTQEKVYQILTELYTNTPDGISGNKDCGQMSAWYLFSSLGFYLLHLEAINILLERHCLTRRLSTLKMASSIQ